MSCFANRFHLEPDKTAMSKNQLELSELSNDGGIGMEALCQSQSARAGILLIHHAHENDIAMQTVLLRFCDGKHARRDTTFHIVGTASIEAPIFDTRLMSVSHTRYTDRVHMPIEQQGFPAARATRNPDHVRAP